MNFDFIGGGRKNIYFGLMAVAATHYICQYSFVSDEILHRQGDSIIGIELILPHGHAIEVEQLVVSDTEASPRHTVSITRSRIELLHAS